MQLLEPHRRRNHIMVTHDALEYYLNTYMLYQP